MPIIGLKGTTMSTIPESVTEAAFIEYVEPYLSKAKRGYVCKIALFAVFNCILYKLHTGCQWRKLPMSGLVTSDKSELSWCAVYWHFRKWSKDGSLEKLFQSSVFSIQEDLDLSEVNLDGSHVIAKKGGEDVEYQGRKKAKTTNVLPLTEANGFVIGLCQLLAGNHNDSYNLKPALANSFKTLKRWGLAIQGAYFNADKAFDTKEARKTCFNHGLIPNIPENPRNRQRAKPGPKRWFNQDIYKHRYVSERSFGWMDKFRHLLIRFDRKKVYFLGANFIAFAMINLRHVFAT
jgi:transposase